MELKGTVHDHETAEPMAGLRIDLWAETRRDTKTVSSTKTDDAGVFHITVELAEVRETMGAPVRTLGLKVFADDAELPVEEGVNTWRFGVYLEDLDLEVKRPAVPEPEPEPEPEPVPVPVAVTAREVVAPPSASKPAPLESETGRVVHGRVCQKDGTALEGVLVRLFHLTLGDRPNLAEARTDADGRYTIRYETELEVVDVYGRAYTDDLDVLATSVVRFGSGPSELLDLVVLDPDHRGPSEFSRVNAAVAPDLEELDLFDLDAEDVAVMVGKTQLPREAIGRYLAALRLAEESGLAPEPLYGVLRAGLPASLRRLLAEDRRRLVGALSEAAERGWVSRAVGAEAPAFAEKVEAALVKTSVSSRTPGSLGRLLDTMQLDKPRQEVVIATFLAHTGTLEEFWNKLRERQDFDISAINDLQLTVRLGVLTLNHAPMVAAVRRRYAPRYGMELARVDRQGWLELMDTSIDGSPVGTPPDIVGDKSDKRRSNYADLLLRQVERAWPTAVVGQALRREARPEDRDLVQFLDDNLDFDFEVHRINAYLADSTSVLTRILDKRALGSKLLRFQRIFRIAPEIGRYGVIRALLEAGLDSAHTVQSWEREAFVARYGEALGSQAAGEVHLLAQGQAALALAVYSQHARALQPPSMPVLPSLQEAVERSEALTMAVPEYTTLFGRAARVSADAPRSVLSQGAYYVDLLRWLNDRRALAALSQRRPDLAGLAPDRANTETELPAIDLVIEQLAERVAPSADGARSRRTTRSSDALLAAPEHVNEAAREALAQAVYPIGLPWDANLAEARAFLGALGVSRAELLGALKWGSRAADKLELAAEALGWNPVGLRIAGSDGPKYDWNYWGYDNAQVQTGSGERAWFQELRRVPTFLERSGLSYTDLRELLQMRAANAGDIELKSATGSLEDVEHVTLERPMGADFARLHRVIRLWRGLGWHSSELDAALTTLAADEVDAALVVKVADLEQLRRHTGLELAELLSWWGPLDAHSGPAGRLSLYARTFLEPTVVGEAAEYFVLDETGHELAYLTRTEGAIPLLDRATELQAALGLDIATLGAALAQVAAVDAGEDAPAPEEVELTLATLSQLYRIVSFARALRKSFPEAAALRRLLGVDPFAGPTEALAFLDRLATLGLDGDGALELTWVLSHDAQAAAEVAPGDEEWQAILDGIRAALGGRPGVTAIPADKTAAEAAVLDAVALGCGVPDWVVERLLRGGLETAGAQPALTLLLDLPKRAAKLSDLPEIARLLVRTSKIGWLVETLDLDEDWLDWLLQHGPAWGLPRLASLPARPGDQPVAIDAFERLVRFVESGSRLPGEGIELPPLLIALERSLEVFVEELADRIGWSIEDLETLVDHLELGDGDVLKDAGQWLRLAEAIALIDRTGASVDRVLSWVTEGVSPQEAREIRLAVRAAASPGEAVRREQALRAPLRTAERDALVLWLRSRDDGEASATGLSGRLLTNVDVGPFALVTRLGEAVQAVQRFVDRCLRGREAVELSAAEAANWPDFESYEAWRERQELFLFPENFLRFEESPWRSPLFERALAALAGDESPGDDVEDIVLSYLDGLDELANLSVVGLFHERFDARSDRVDRLHVVGRTRGLPHRHFYRERLDGRRWTAWEPLDLPIGTEPVLPVTVAGRTWLVWPLFSPDEAAGGAWIQLASSERKPSGFAAPRLSSDALWSPLEPGRVPEAAHTFRTRVEDGDVVVQCQLLPPSSDWHTETTVRELGTFRLRPSGALRSQAAPGFATRLCPFGLRPVGNHFASAEGGRGVWFTAGELDARRELVEGTSVHVSVLGESVGPAQLAVPHQYGDFASQDGFFVEDEARVFFVEPAREPLTVALHRLMETDQADLSAVGHLVDVDLVVRKPPELDEPTTSGIPYYAEPPPAVPGTEADPHRPLCVPGELELAEGRRLLLDTHRVLSAFEREEGDPLWLRGLRGRYVFALHSHAFASQFLRAAARDGAAGVLDPGRGGDPELRRQQATRRFFRKIYAPEAVERPLPDEAIRFSIDDPNGLYNWELFVFLPLVVARALSAAGDYGRAETWFHVVFDPQSRDADVPFPQRYWKAKPLMGAGDAPIEQFLRLLGDARDPVTRRRLEDRVADWADDPSDPHALANLRSQTWRLAVVMAYLDHVLAWAEDLAEDGSTMAAARASGLYELAGEILGPRPTLEADSEAPESYASLEQHGGGGLSEVLVAVENLVGVRRKTIAEEPERIPPLGPVGPFEVPFNPRLLRYWDRVDVGMAALRAAGAAL